MFLRNHTSILNRFAVRVVFSVALIILSIREYLFGNGLYIYRDWTWPLSNSLTPVANFSPGIIRNNGPDPLGFVRIFVTWPIVVFDRITANAVLAEKAYVLYFFSVFILLFFILAELLTRLLNRISGTIISPARRELLVLSVVLVCFVNFWSLEQLSDLYFTYVIEFALIGISVTLSLSKASWTRKTVLPGALLGLCIFLDPNLYPYGLIAVVLTILCGSLLDSFSPRQLAKALARIGTVFAITLPPLITMLFVFSLSTGTNLRPLGNFQASSGNLSLINAMRLIGYWWSLIVYSPPAIISSGVVTSQLSSVGAPPYMLLPSNAVTVLWVLSTWTVPTLAFGTAVFSPLRKLTIPVSVVGIVGLLFTQPSLFPYPYWLATNLSGIPMVGGALVTFLAIPDHALVIAATSFTLLIATGIYSLLAGNAPGYLSKLLQFRIGSKTSNIARRDTRQVGVVLIILTLLIFSGWQFFSGSFYPSGYIWGGSGNGVSSVGAFSASEPPPEMVQVYDWLLSQPGNFNIYWPGPTGASYPWTEKATGSIALSDSPKPAIFPKALPYLISSNLTADIKDYLASLNVRYLVAQPFSRIAMQFDWGVGDVGSLDKVLRSTQGVNIAQSVGEITVYEVEGPWGALYSSPLVASHNSSDPTYAIAYRVFASLGTRIAISDPTTTENLLCFNSTKCSVSLMSPGGLAFQSSSKISLIVLNDTPSLWQDFVLGSGQTAPLPNPSNMWAVTNWGAGNATVGIENATMHWTFGQGAAYLTLNYNGTLVNYRPGGISVQPNQVVTTQAGFWYRTSGGFDGSLQIVVPQLNRTGNIIAEATSQTMPPSPDWKYATFNMTLPFNTAYFTTRFVAEASKGTVDIRDVRADYVLLQRNASTSFGFTLPLLGGNLNFELPRGQTLVQFEGNGTLHIDGQAFALNSPNEFSWYSHTRQLESNAELSGNIQISTIVFVSNPLEHLSDNQSTDNNEDQSINLTLTNAVVYTRPFARGYTLASSLETFSPHQTLDGLNLFLDVGPGAYTVSLSQVSTAQIVYLATLGMLFGIIVGESRKLLFRSPRESAPHAL